MKTIARADGQSFRLGRRRPPVRGLRLSLKNYLLQSLPTPPASIDYSAKAANILSEPLGNDVLGDCVCAMVYHADGTMLANAGQTISYNAKTAVELYAKACGYKPGDPKSDQGCDETAVLNYWKETGVPGDANKIVGWLDVDATNWVEVQTAQWLFENLCFGVELPDAWINPMPSASGFVWGIAGPPNPDNGHAFAGVGYSSAGVTIATWGMTGTVTPAAIAQYMVGSAGGGLYVVLTQDAINKATQLSASGFDWTQLQADFQAVA